VAQLVAQLVVLAGSFAGAALGAQVGQLRQQLGGFAEYAASIEKLKIALNGIAGDASNYNRALQAAADVTKELNIPQEVAIRGITRLTAAVKGAGGGIADAELAFKNINSAIIATGGGAEQVEGAVTALVQIFSKGKVSAEEINQIAERLPGTFNKIAEASGRTGPELTKALQKGEVGLNDLMKFLVQLGGEYGELAEKIAGSSESAGARLTVAYNKMRIEIGKALQPIGAEFQEAFTDFVENITPTLVATLPKLGAIFLEVAKNLDVLAAAATAAGLAMGIIAAKAAVIKAKGIIALFKGIAASATAAGVAVKGLSAAVLLNPWVLLAAGVTAATVGVVKYYQGQKELNELLDEGKGSTETIKAKMQEYRDEITKATAKLKGINGEQKATGRQANALKTKIAELRSELNRLDGTYKIRIKFESKGFKFDDKNEMVEFTSGGIVYGGPKGARAKALRRVDGTPLEGLTDYGSPGDEDDKGKDKGIGKVRKSQLPQLQDKYDSLIRSGPLADIQRFQIANSLALVRAQKDNNTELVYTIKNNAINLDFGEKELELKNKYLDAMNAANKTEDIAERQLQERIAELERDLGLEKLIVSANGQLLALKQDQAIASEIIAKASEDELFNLRDQLGLVTNEQRIERFRQSRIDAGDPNAEQQTDLFRQTIDPTLTEGLSQNIRSLKKELEDLVNPINQITGAANAIGSAFSQSFTDAISGSKSAKEALADFFQECWQLFLGYGGADYCEDGDNRRF
jgi:tape measure domain-containing protein